ncbi:MAG: hypothetical protein H3C26_14115 [Rhodocyclaceae bacterium]|nr:hypothetical protein [Rhodocyclaceae bacterium]
MSNVENQLFEHLKKIQAEQTAARERDAEIVSRLARISRDESANHAEIVENRHAFDKLRERIERRLEING